MLLKWIGGLCIIIGCGSVGFRIAANQRKEERTLEMLKALISYMQCELQYRLTPLPELCRKTAAEASGNLRRLFLLLAQELDDQIAPNAESCMQVAISKCNDLPEKSQICLQSLGKTLGRFDLDGQVRGLDAVTSDCKRQIDALQHNKEERLRSYQTLGLCAGAGLVILFI